MESTFSLPLTPPPSSLVDDRLPPYPPITATVTIPSSPLPVAPVLVILVGWYASTRRQLKRYCDLHRRINEKCITLTVNLPKDVIFGEGERAPPT